MQGLFFQLLLICASAWVSSQQDQHPLSSSIPKNASEIDSHPFPAPVSGYNKGPFSAVKDFSYISLSSFTHLTHPLFPHHNVRIKKTDFCDPSVNSYTGYIDNKDRHLFFYFFESRNDPTIDDVIFWTNGGPGCSSSMGLFMELGPCRISDETGPKYFPYSWNSNANVFFVEQPVGVGYSYADNDEVVTTSEEAAADIAAFVVIFFENFVQFKGRRFHMAGESYGGRYVPLFASTIYDQNTELVQAGWTPINLVSVIIGNGVTDLQSFVESFYGMLCTPASLTPVMNIASCIRMKQVLPRCLKWVKESCIDTFESINCEAAAQFCLTELALPLLSSGKNPYDISKQCEGSITDNMCYPTTDYIAKYLDRSDTRTRLQIPGFLSSRSYSMCSDKVSDAFKRSQDHLHSSHLHVAALLERGIKVLIYAGTHDFACNWIANERWTSTLDWSGGGDFSRETLRAWNVSVPREDGKGNEVKRAGRVRSKGGLTFATVEGAGHMVPYDKPQEALAMINRWLAGVDL